MAIIINDDGTLAVGPADDPARKANAELTERLAWHLECQLQSQEFYADAEFRQRQQIAALDARITFLERLLCTQQIAA